MGQDFFPEDTFDWEDDDDDIDISIDEMSQDEIDDIDDAWIIHRKQQINRFVKAAYENDGISAMTDLLCAIERQTNWRVEIIADKSGLEEMTFRMYSAFEENLWENFINSSEYREMVHNIADESNRKAQIFVEKHLGLRSTISGRVSSALRRLAQILE